MFAVLPIERYYEKMCLLLNAKPEQQFKLLGPDWIFGKIGWKNWTRTWIEDWIWFEHGKLPNGEYWDENNFYNLVLKDLPNQKVMLLTDEGIREKKCFKFDLNSFYEFVEWYEDKYQMEFMQPHDYIIILENNMIKILHHGGVVLEQNSPMIDKEISDGIGKIMGLLLAKGSS
ncbi:hypothetical protein [Emticicia fontis]